VRTWGTGQYEREISPTCKKCLELVAYQLKPLWSQTFPEVKAYHEWVKRRLRDYNNVVPCFGPLWLQGQRTHRYRDVSNAESSFCAGANNGFQAFIADVTKTAERKASRETYLDQHSVLFAANARFPAFEHDELLWEAQRDLAPEVGRRVGEIMHEAYNEWIPDVHIEGVESALMYHWSKDAESLYEVFHDGASDVALADYLTRAAGWKPERAGAAAREGRAVLGDLGHARGLAALARQLGGTASEPKLVVWEPGK
jgi:hypothetical protein